MLVHRASSPCSLPAFRVIFLLFFACTLIIFEEGLSPKTVRSDMFSDAQGTVNLTYHVELGLHPNYNRFPPMYPKLSLFIDVKQQLHKDDTDVTHETSNGTTKKAFNDNQVVESGGRNTTPIEE